MLSNQMQQTAQNMTTQQSMFHQQMQMQLAAIDKRAETTEKYLRQIAKSLGRNKKRKKGESDDEEDTSDDE
jgi:proteasome assembly chaperone (PAC2) family protein